MLPKVVRDTNDPELLRKFLTHTMGLLDKSQKRVHELEAEKAKKDQKILKLDDQLTAMQKRHFGKSSEKRSRRRSTSEDKLTLHGASLLPPPDKKELQELTEILVKHKLNEDQLADIAEEYGYPRDSKWELMKGFYDESEELDVVVQSYVRKRNRQFKYRLKASVGTDNVVIIAAPGSNKIMPGAKYSAELAVDVVASKYLYHLPFERIRRQMEAAGLTIAVKTLYSLCFFVHCYLENIAAKIKEEILTCGLALHIDETRWPINITKQSDGYMWVMSNQAGSYYQFEPTRSGKIAKELIGSYVGPVVTDGFSGYKARIGKLDHINLAFCWAHARRKFTDIEKNYPKEVAQVLDLMGELFHVEKIAKDFDDLKSKRLNLSTEIIIKIKDWLMEAKMKARSESELLKAINYCMNHWSGLIKFLDDVRIPLTNNEVERTIRHSVMGRKNFYGSRSINGADVTSTLYTIVESCKKVELEPKAYILMAVKKKIIGQEPLTPLEYAKSIRVKTA